MANIGTPPEVCRACQRFGSRHHRTRRPCAAGFRPMSPDSSRRVRNRWPSGLLSRQPFASRPPNFAGNAPQPPAVASARAGRVSRPSRLAAPLQGRLTPFETRARIRAGFRQPCAAPVYPASRPACQRFDRPPVATIGSGDHVPRRIRRHHRTPPERRAVCQRFRRTSNAGKPSGFRSKAATIRPLAGSVRQSRAGFAATIERRNRSVKSN